MDSTDDALSRKKEREAKAIANEALIESSFRRLLAAVEAERAKLRSTQQEIESVAERNGAQLEALRLETEDWCRAEQQKVEDRYKRVDEARERMTVLTDQREVAQINCSGHRFKLPLACLIGLDGSLLNHMFSEAYIGMIPRDKDNNYFFDFNPTCFGIIVECLKRRHPGMLQQPALGRVPPEEQLNMDVLIDALRLRQIVQKNRMNPRHGTSLHLCDNGAVQAMHDGCQIISAEFPLIMSRPSYFEVKIIKNPSQKGGLAVGVCGHIPTGAEVHSIRLKEAIVYSSHNGLIGGNVDMDNVQRGLQMVEGSTFGVKYEPVTRCLTWYQKKIAVGSCTIAAKSLEKMRVLYPIFAMFDPGQEIMVDFSLTGPDIKK